MSNAATVVPAAAPFRREVGVTELVLRDAHQSPMATRMALEDLVDACTDIDAAGTGVEPARRCYGCRLMTGLRLPRRSVAARSRETMINTPESTC